MLDGLFVAPAVTAIGEALASAGAKGRLAVIGSARLAAGLAASRDVIPVGLSPRAAKRLTGTVDDLAALDADSLDAVVGTDPADITTLQAWSRVVKDGGAIVLVERGGKASDASRRALCAGLTELEQRHAGRTVVTSGLVSKL